MEFFAGTAPTFVRWRCAQYDSILALAACEHFGRSRGEFDDGCVVDRWDWRAIGRSPHGRSWHPDGPEFRQYPDSVGYGRGLHRGDHAQPLGSRSGTEENSSAAWP